MDATTSPDPCCERPEGRPGSVMWSGRDEYFGKYCAKPKGHDDSRHLSLDRTVSWPVKKEKAPS